jgi:hypothetical protein
VLWQANTVYSTMGLLTDSNGIVQQLVSVNCSGANTTRYGTIFSNFGVGGTLANPAVIYDRATDALYGNTNPSFASGTSGTTPPKIHRCQRQQSF